MREFNQFIVILLFLSNTYVELFAQKKVTTDHKLNDVFVLIDSARDKNYTREKRKSYLDRACQLAVKERNDSLRNAYFLKLSFTYGFRFYDSLSFRKFNRLSTELSKKINDSINLANNYWDLGQYYTNNNLKDSAYYAYFKAKKIFEAKNESLRTGQMLINMAIIQEKLKDYTGSEITTIEAIKQLKPLNEYRQLYRCYNNLGVIFNEMGEYDKALFYYNEALDYQKKIKGENDLKENLYNNIGLVYQNMDEYEKAIQYFQEALKNKKYTSKIEQLARSKSNLAISKLKLGDTVEVYDLLQRTLYLRDSIHNIPGITSSKMILAEFYLYKKDTLKAIEEAKDVVDIASSINNAYDKLQALKFLSIADKNYLYANQYIELSDSLVKQERVIRNKFARIRFETDEIIEQTEKLSEQRKFILLGSGGLLLLGSLLFIIRSQRARNKELKLEQAQQNANEEIYNLMLSQQYKLDEGRRREKKRISEELHDGVLGKLFGTRLILGSLNRAHDDESIAKKEKFINDLQEIEQEIRNVSHELNEQSTLLDIGYTSLIKNLLEQQSELSNFQYEFKNDEKIRWEEIGGSLKMNLYRIIQEAIQNINKYAAATTVLVTFSLNSNSLSLLIKDNGVGFDTESKVKGIGLKNMRSRVKLMNGELKINSKPEFGTEIIIDVPV